MTSHFLVQWMPGPCTEAGPNREFSLITLKDIREDYRYALECGRITMATYKFSAGEDTGSMHRLCKIIGSGEQTALESEMLSVMRGGTSQTTTQPDQSAIDDITCILKVEEMDDDVTHVPAEINQSSSSSNNKAKYPPWEVQQEMIALLDENHQLKRENDLCRKKLAKAVDVMDLRNILETTIVNIQQKQLIQPMEEQSHLGSEPQTSTTSNDSVDLAALAMALSQDNPPALASPPVSRPATSRQQTSTVNTSFVQEQTIRAPLLNTSAQQPQRTVQSSVLQQQQHSPRTLQTVNAALQQQQQQQIRPVQPVNTAPPPQQRPVQPINTTFQAPPRQAQVQQQQQQRQQQQQIQQLQQQQRQQQMHTPPATSQTQQQQDNPYIVRVQSLAEPPNTQPARQVMPARTDRAGLSSSTARMGGGYQRTSQIGRGLTVSQRLGAKRQHGVGKQRPIRPPQWQSSYVTEGVQQLQRARSGSGEMGPGVSEVIDIPSTSTQRPPPQQEQRLIHLEEGDDGDADKLVELVPGMGVKLPRRQLMKAQKTKGFSQYTRNLMMLIFTMKELSVCSVTGYKATGRGSENAVARPALDQTRVHAIIAAVLRRFPTVSQFEVKQIMSQKLMNLRQSLRRKQLKRLHAERIGRSLQK